MKKQVIGSAILLASAGGAGYQAFHKGGIYNPHVIPITEKMLEATATDDLRYCTFRPKVPFDVDKGDFIALHLPRDKEVKFRILESTKVKSVFVKCNKNEIDIGKIALSLKEQKAILEVCSEEAENCTSNKVQDPKAYINKLVKPKGK